HRDLKPDNVALGDFGEVVVLDWGFAKEIPEDRGQRTEDRGQRRGQRTEDRGQQRGLPVLCPLSSGHSVAGQVLGTPAYMAPEQAAGGGPIDERTDVYGLGAILYEVLTGRPPYAGEDGAEVLRRVRSGPPPRPVAVKPGVPPALEAVCLKALARDPEG